MEDQSQLTRFVSRASHLFQRQRINERGQRCQKAQQKSVLHHLVQRV